ncbi:type IV pilus modification protein PilV [Acidovorax sp. BL-A-41-H1]|uniref:type IV pilus modification protein PilV n=1 Tax=Acidovorax sp. BL-A-41-H1 TaxID=3421102 RepID=UPI003F7ADB40
MKPLCRSQRGAALIESLVSMLIVAFGVLGFVGLQGRTAVANLEGYQRSQALILVNDMAERLRLNPGNAAMYIVENVGAAEPSFCANSTVRAQQDVCAWRQSILGAGEKEGNALVGAVANARGCISSPASDQYLVALAWQGLQATGSPAASCGRDTYAREDTRRVVSVVVQIARLGNAP